MRRTARLGALGAALAVGVGALAPAAEPTPKANKAESPSWLDRLTPSMGAKSPGDGKSFGDTPARPPLAIAPLEPAALAAALRAEQDAWDRRLEVCYKLRVVGGETNDEALIHRANELEQQATALYHSRAARLGVKPKLRGEAAPLGTGPSALATPTRVFKEVTP
jgi:hypothetical protein